MEPGKKRTAATARPVARALGSLAALALGAMVLAGLVGSACKPAPAPAAAMCAIQPTNGPSPGTPTKIMQLVGDLDRETRPPTPTRASTETTVGL